jgi:hypothetical protein
LKGPFGLLPIREVDHCISLKEGIEPIHVWPYCYVYYQKKEIEKQVHGMLNSSLIQPSTRPFSSSALLVKKKRWKLAFLHELSCTQRYHREGPLLYSHDWWYVRRALWCFIFHQARSDSWVPSSTS